MQADTDAVGILEVTPKEWRWVTFVSIGVLMLTLIPYIAGYYFTPPGKVFSGLSMISFFDIPVYLSWLEQAKEGHLFFVDLFTTASQQRVFFHPIYALLGAITHLGSFSPIAVYHVGRILIGFIFLLTAYRFIAHFFIHTFHRKICFLLLVLSSGIGPLNDALSMYYMPEINVFISLFVSVNNTASMAIMLAVFSLMLHRFSSVGFAWSACAGLLLSLLLFIHPYDLLIVFVVGAVFSVFRIIAANELNTLRSVLLMTIFTLPAIILQAYTFSAVPILAEWASYTSMPSPSPWMYLSGLGVLVPLALIGAFTAFRKKNIDQTTAFILIWLMVVSVLIYAPFLLRFQRKFSEGADIPLAILATFGIAAILASLDHFNKKLGKIFLVLVFIIGIKGTPGMIFVRVAEYHTGVSRAYLTNDEDQTLDWIAGHLPKESRILSGPTLGAAIPWRTGNTVFIGNYDLTPHYDEKLFLLQKTFAANGSGRSRALYLLTQREHIDHVLIDNELRTWSGGIFAPPVNANWERIYENSAITLYKINSPSVVN